MSISTLGRLKSHKMTDLHPHFTMCMSLNSRARWFLWNVSANSHMTSVTKRNMLDPTGKVGDCSYTPHNHHPLGWIFLQGENMSFFSFLIFFRKHCLHNVLNLHQLPNGTYRCYNCVPHILPTPCTSLTYVAEKVLLRQGKNGKNKPKNHQHWNLAKIAPKSDKFMK